MNDLGKLMVAVVHEPGLTTREYAEVLGIPVIQVSRAAYTLKKTHKITEGPAKKIEGRRMKTLLPLTPVRLPDQPSLRWRPVSANDVDEFGTWRADRRDHPPVPTKQEGPVEMLMRVRDTHLAKAATLEAAIKVLQTDGGE
jgi:hypothetical protein